MKKNRAAVLRAEVRSLAIHLSGVVSLPECIQQLFVTQYCRVEGHLHYFRVPGFIGANIFVRGVGHLPAAVAYGGIDHSRHAFERGFDAPKTPPSKCRDLSHASLPFVPTLFSHLMHGGYM